MLGTCAFCGRPTGVAEEDVRRARAAGLLIVCDAICLRAVEGRIGEKMVGIPLEVPALYCTSCGRGFRTPVTAAATVYCPCGSTSFTSDATARCRHVMGIVNGRCIRCGVPA